MREKLHALATALIVPIVYMVIQIFIVLIFDNDQYNMLVADLAGLLLAILLIRREPEQSRADLPRRLDGSSVVLLLVCGVALSVLISYILSLMPFPDSVLEDYEQFEQMLDQLTPWMHIVVVCLVTPLVEELLFRGVCYRSLRRAFSARAAIVMQALLFAVFHFRLYQIAGVFPAAIVLGLVYEWSGSLIAPIILHVSFNSAGIILALTPGIPDTWYLPLSIIGTAATISSLYKRRNNA